MVMDLWLKKSVLIRDFFGPPGYYLSLSSIMFFVSVAIVLQHTTALGGGRFSTSTGLILLLT